MCAMCWNEPVSWTTLAVGTALNVGTCVLYPTKPVIATSVCWEWALLMQMSDALAWHSLKHPQNSNLNSLASDMAFVFNLTQPVVTALVFLAIDVVEQVFVYVAVSLLLLYVMVMVVQARKLDNKRLYLRSLDGHLDYHWWREKPYASLGKYFLFSLLAFTLLLLRPLTFALLESGFIVATVLLAWFFFKRTSPTMWCWFAAFAPLFTALFWWISEKHPLVSEASNKKTS